MKAGSIIYVNFTPYENTGKILDYLLENYRYLYSFTFDFHQLKEPSKLQVFENGRIIYQKQLLTIPTTESLIFFLLPIRSVLILVQIFWYVWLLRHTIQRPCYYFTVNAFTIWIGNLLKRFGFVDKTIFWVWDYYPPHHPNLIVRTMRRIYWYFDSWGSHSDKVIYLNFRLQQLRQRIGVIAKNGSHLIIPIGTNPINRLQKPDPKQFRIGFIGVLKRSQGLELVLRNWSTIIENFPNAQLEIIGAGPDQNYLKNLAHQNKVRAKFYGLLREQISQEDHQIKQILQKCQVGIATYIPEKSNVSFYGDPSKIKKYLSLGLPVITTDVFEFSPILIKQGAGIIINYHKPHELIKALHQIRQNKKYPINALNLAKQYDYRRIYPLMFDFTAPANNSTNQHQSTNHHR